MAYERYQPHLTQPFGRSFICKEAPTALFCIPWELAMRIACLFPPFLMGMEAANPPFRRNNRLKKVVGLEKVAPYAAPTQPRWPQLHPQWCRLKEADPFVFQKT